MDDDVNNMRAEYRDDQLPGCKYQRHSFKPTEPNVIYISSDEEVEVESLHYKLRSNIIIFSVFYPARVKSITKIIVSDWRHAN